MAVARLALTSFTDGELRLSDEVELYQRTYTTLLRSSGETQLRVLEPSHMAMGSSLHPLAASEELDLGAFLYAVQRLPDGIAGAELVVMGQDVEALTVSGLPVDSWEEAEAPARRRRWYDNGAGTLAVLLASSSDVDDLVPTLVAFQIEWNKIRVRMRAAGWPDAPRSPEVPPEELARELGGSPDDWARLRGAWGERFGERMRLIGERRLSLRVRMLGGSHTGYARLTRRWWAPVAAELAGEGLTERPLYFVSSNSHSLVNIVTGIAHDLEPELIAFVEQLPDDDILREELAAFRDGRSQGSWENFLYFVARLYFSARGAGRRSRAPRRRAAQGRHPSAQHERVARAGAGHLAGRARPRVARPAARPGRPRRARCQRRGYRQHRLSARRCRLQHPPRDRGRPHRRCAACTSSARPRRSTPTSAT